MIFNFPASCRFLFDTVPYFLSRVLIKYYQHILTMIFAIKMNNENLQLLPNITLGFNIYDNYGGEYTYHASMELSSSQKQFISNYKCGILNKLISVFGTLDPAISYDMANILVPYKVPLVRCINDTSFTLSFVFSDG